MITYEDSLFGFRLIFRVHGSAVWKASLPALFSTLMLLLYIKISGGTIEDNHLNRVTENVYTIGAYIAFFGTLLTFRLNFAYSRYWEGATAVHQMHSKWLDIATYLAAFHYQCRQYDQYRPPSFGNNHKLRNITREREREDLITKESTLERLKDNLEVQQEEAILHRRRPWHAFLSRRKPKIPPPSGFGSKKKLSSQSRENAKNISSGGAKRSAQQQQRIPAPRNFHDQFSVPMAAKSMTTQSFTVSSPMSSSHLKQQKSMLKNTEGRGIPCPSLFLQESAHLVSLLSGVALSTLRNDIDGANSPLAEYYPGQPMPPVDPDNLPIEIRQDWESGSRILSAFYYLLGLTRDDKRRTLYNAARPFQILGGVSDLEIHKLQLAHGPYAKVALCSMYLQEFVARECQSGSTGKIPGPLISRITHVLSDGMTGYNQARKLAYNPFPFPHAQMTTFFTLAVLFIFPLLYYSFVNNLAFACTMNFVTVLCFLGIHSVARELEDPFKNVPNDLPLTTFQAQFNEALVTIYAGFHPDSWWEVENETDDNLHVGTEKRHPVKS